MPSYLASRISDVALQATLETQASGHGTLNAGHPLIVRLRQLVPFEQYMISGIDYSGLGLGNGVFLASDLPEEGIKAYFENGLVRKDPLAKKISTSTPTVSWHDLTPKELESSDAQELEHYCKVFGIAPRTSFALCLDDRMYGAATFSRERPFTPDEKMILLAVARQAHTELSRSRMTSMNQHLGLSTGEVACLQAMANGESIEEAGARLGYAAETVQTYLKSLIKKLGANNRAHAIAEGFRRCLLR